ncbi:ankyrin repeat domain-containing protein [Candidatus Tisiphia endosymbiont of Nemotelus uliginosus]|uniref:ankyrin repeat domain-containing protein n=1 Tax=Candidatus Tisiphia endosymbiont of Nemotelus uliginosus TaxID=3077926 RepID=UPI0035C8BBB5
MAKNVELLTTAPQELERMLIVGPRHQIPLIIKELYNNTDNWLIIGDGIKDIELHEIKTTLKKQNKVIGPATNIDLQTHGGRYKKKGTVRHIIELNKHKTVSAEFIYELCTLNGKYTDGPKCINFYSCNGSTATNKTAIEYLSNKLKKKLIIITHVDAKSVSNSMITDRMYIDSIKESLEKKPTPHQQFIYELPRNWLGGANFVEFEEDGTVHKFKTTRIVRPEIVDIIIKTLASMPKDETAALKLVRFFLREDARRFMYQFENVVDQPVYASMRKAIQDIEQVDEQSIKNFITATLLHSINNHADLSNENTLEAQNRRNNINELIIKLLPPLKQGGTDLDNNLATGMTLLQQAMSYRNLEVIEAVLKCGINPDEKDFWGSTPLYTACDRDNVEIATLLLEHKANPNEKSSVGYMPLHKACEKGNVKIATLLLEHKANPDEQTSGGYTPLYKACEKGNVKIARVLLEHKANPDAKSPLGHTPLHEACEKGNVKIATLLLEHKANPDEQTSGGYTPLYKACEKGNVEMVRLLLQHEAQPDNKMKYDLTPLNNTWSQGNVKIIKLLLMAVYKQKQRAEADGQQLDNIMSEINQGSLKIPGKLFKRYDIQKLEELIEKVPNTTLTLDKEQDIIHYQLVDKEEIKELHDVIAKRRAILDTKAPNVNELPDQPSLSAAAKLAVENIQGKISHVPNEKVGTEAQILSRSASHHQLPQQDKSAVPITKTTRPRSL